MLITKESPSKEMQHCVVCDTSTSSIYQAKNIPLCPECAIHASEDSLMEAASKSGYKFVSEILKTCLKCGYKRTPDDFGPEIECPKCGAIYAKVAAAIKMASKPKPDIDTKNNPKLAGGSEKQTSNKNITKCKVCKKGVSKTAKVCPHCGEKDPGIGVADQIAGVVGLILIGWLVYGFIAPDSGQSKSSKRQDSNRLAEASVLCKDAIRIKANYGTKADFAWKVDHHRNGNIYTVYGKVDLMNGFGAMLPYKYACDVDVERYRVLTTLMTPD